jgi:predicted nucleotidyltransferase
MNKEDIDNLTEVIVNKLKVITVVKAIVLGGSRADGSNRPDSDIDLGIYYDNKETFDLIAVKKLAQELNDTSNPVVTSIGKWGKWVNGGAWLTINGQRVDFLYRDLNFVKQIIQDCNNGIKQSDYYQQPPYGFHSYIYCAEIQICKVLFDPEGIIENLKSETKEYPSVLKNTIINGSLWDAEFTLVHCKKSAQRSETIIVAGCLTKIASDFIQVLYALNKTYFIGEKKLYKQVPLFQDKPNNFLERINKILGAIGNEVIQNNKTVDETEKLFNDLVTIAGSEYHPKFKI